MRTFLFLLVVLTGCSRSRERIVCVGFDTSATAWRGGNPYDAGWVQILDASQGGDHMYAALINEKGLANGSPVIDFTIRPYNFFTDKSREYDEAVRAKLEKERQLLGAILKNQTPSRTTEIIGFFHAASQIFRAYPAGATKELVVWSDGLQESEPVNLAKSPLADRDIANIIQREQGTGRLPNLKGVEVWFVTGPSLQTARFNSDQLLRVEVFWTRYLQACGAELRAYGPVLVNFGS